MQHQPLPARFLDHVRSQRLFPEPGQALVAVSGGADSLALLYLLHDRADELGLQLLVGHVDHGIAEESATWATRVRDVAEGLGVPCLVERVDLGSGTSETAARRARYRVLRGWQREHDARYLVTAHHADDQIETVLYRFLRGSGPAGLAGIAARGPAGLVRPLLPFHRQELREWLAARAPDLEPVADPSNRDTRHDRVWVRSHLLPGLRERFGRDVEDRLLAGAADARRERVAWSALLHELPDLEFTATGGGIEVARSGVRAYDNTLGAALLRAAAREAGCVIGPTGARRLVRFVHGAESGRRLELGRGWVADIEFDRVRLHRPDAGEADLQPVPWGEDETGEVRWGTWHIRWRPEDAGTVRRHDLTTWVTAGAGDIRGFRAGDRLRPRGGTGHRKVRRLLMEARIPRWERHTYPLVTRGDEILWIPGVCRSEASLPRPGEPAVRLDAHRD